MRKFLSFTALVAFASAVSSAATEISCGYVAPDGTKFDLSQQQGHVITATDARDEGYESQFVYQVGICTDIKTVPEVCKWPMHAKPEPCANGCSALQYLDCPSQQGCTCERISGPLSMSNGSRWSLLDTKDPSLGVSLTYYNGGKCSVKQADGSKKTLSRSIKMDFVCAERGYIPNTVDVSEDNLCEYHMTFYTSYGCPTSCPMGSVKTDGGALTKHSVCSGKGVCRFDNDKKSSQCFCDKGWHGNDCSAQGDKKIETVAGSSGGAIVGALFGGCALGVMIGGAVYYYFVVYRPKHSGSSSPSNYAEAPEAAAWQGTSTTYQPPENSDEGQQQQTRDEPLLA